jgi:Zn-dependent M28 family amino/carboxypeptidase
MRRLWIAIMTISLATAVFAAKANAPKFDPEKIRAHVKYLSSDELEGRGMNQKGGDLAAEYIAAQFKSYGLKPAGENGTYFQQVPMVGMKTLADTTFALVPSSGAAVELKALDDYVTTNERQTESAEIDAPIVFVGYGISAPEYQWDDYKGYDLKGKVALLFVNQPVSDDPKFFKGKTLTYYGRWTYKFEETARRGAIATLIIHREDLASYPWTVVRNSWGGEKSFLKLDGTPKLAAASWIQQDVAKKLVGMAGLDLDKLFQQAQSRDFKPIPLPANLKAQIVSSVHPYTSRNVLAMVRGSDPAKRREAILYTAHYDHFGIDKTKPAGANIFHGAADNATGCGILLELGRVWAGTKPAPARSILLAAVTAEEQGLLGSEYLGKHTAQLPALPILDLNYDDLPPIGIPEDVEVVGAERTTFYPAVEETAKKFNLTIRPDSRPEAGHYYRSDHFSLGRVGIPAFSVSEGMKYQGHDTAWGLAEAKEYVEHRYHQPTDIYTPDMDFRGDALMAEFGYALGQKAANAAAAPAWLPGDEFAPGAQRNEAASPMGSSLLDGTGLEIAYYEPLDFPPLARATRISGDTAMKLSVSGQGEVDSVTKDSGHPLFTNYLADTVSKWKFVNSTTAEKTIDLNCEFILVDSLEAEGAPPERITVDSPGHVKIASVPLIFSDPPGVVGKKHWWQRIL